MNPASPIPAAVPRTDSVTTKPTPEELRKSELDNAFVGINNLLHFSCRNAVAPVGFDSKQYSELLGRITTARELHSQAKLEKDAEVQFFMDFGALTAAFKPVTIGSLHDSQSTSLGKTKKYFFWGPNLSKPTSIVRRFSICSVLSLFVLLYAQIVWISGTTIQAEFQKISIEWANEMADESKPLSSSDTHPALNEEVSPKTPALKASAIHERKLSELRMKANAFVELVKQWETFSLGAVTVFNKVSYEQPSGAAIESIGVYADLKFTSTAILLNVYATYVLPLLYGLMGACCYMLREIIREIRQKTFRSDTEMSYWVRLFLGVLAGLAIGWFLRTESETPTGIASDSTLEPGKSILSLAPMALSFLAGYSVELLFSAMDRLVVAFGSTSKTSPS